MNPHNRFMEVLPPSKLFWRSCCMVGNLSRRSRGLARGGLYTILLTWLTARLSVTMLERTMRRKADEEYMRKTSAFFPWFPEA